MDFELSEELAAVRDLAREFAEKEIAPTAARDDKEKNFRPISSRRWANWASMAA